MGPTGLTSLFGHGRKVATAGRCIWMETLRMASDRDVSLPGGSSNPVNVRGEQLP